MGSDALGTALVVALTAAVVVAAWQSPFHAFCVFLAALPFESALAIQGPLTVTPAYVALIVAVLALIAHPRRRIVRGTLESPISRYLVAYLFVAALSLTMTIIAPPPQVAAATELLRWRVGSFRSIVQYAFLCFSAGAFFVTLFFCSTPQRLRFATRLFVVVAAITALYGLFQMIGVRYRAPLVGTYAAGLYETPASLRPNATFQEAMNFGHFIVAALPVLIALRLHAGKRATRDDRGDLAYRAAALPMIAVMATALFVTIGRGAWLGGGVAMLLVLAASERFARRRAVGLGAVAVVAAVVFVWFTFESFDSAITTVLNRVRFQSATVQSEQRLWYFPFLLGLVREYPVLGVGYGNYPVYQVFAFGLYGIAGAYGVFWQALVDTGVIGFVALIAVIFRALWALSRALTTTTSLEWRPYLVGWTGALAGLSVAHLFFGDRFSLYMWVAMGLAMSTVRLALRPADPA